MEKFIKYFWIDFGDPSKDIYVELSSEEGKQGARGGKFLVSFESDSPKVLASYLGTNKVSTDGIVRTRFDSLDAAESFFDALYKKSTNKSDMIVG